MITYDQYKNISDLLGVIYATSNDAIGEIIECQSLEADTQAVRGQNFDWAAIKQSLSRTKEIITRLRSGVPRSLNAAVTALQSHVLRYYDSVDAFLEAGSVLVSSDFAALSGVVSFAIASGNVEL